MSDSVKHGILNASNERASGGLIPDPCLAQDKAVASPSKKAFPLRLDPALFAAVARLAATDFRSANAEMEVLLREALARRGVTVGASEAPKRGRPPKQGE